MYVKRIPPVKVGDLVRWESVLNDSVDHYEVDHGIVIQLSKTGHTTKSANVLFMNGETAWFDTQRLTIVHQS